MTDWLKLLRISAAPSAAANISSAAFVSGFDFSNWLDLIWLTFSSVSLYCSGMVLNDLCDVQIDMIENPNRPLASGKIKVRSARFLYWLLTIIGLTSSAIVSTLSFIVSVLIVVAIIAYNFVFKRTTLAPIFMGCCRTLNYIQGATVVVAVNPIQNLGIQQIPTTIFLVAIGLGIFICGLTYFAQNEVTIKHPNALRYSAVIVVVGWTTMLMAYFVTADYTITEISSPKSVLFWVGFSLICCWVFRKFIVAIHRMDPQWVRSTVGATIKSLVLFDACLCLLSATYPVVGAVITVSLLIPAYVLGRWIYNT